jgi:hypothetical protein
MLGVGFCGVCGASLAQQFTGRKAKMGPRMEWRYYRCGRTPVSCKGVFIRADIGDELLEQTFLERWGDTKVTRRVFVPGEDHTHELEQVEATITRLRRESDAGLLTTSEDERIWLERLRAQTARRDQLSEAPVRASGWITEETDQTYREVWATEDHRQLLLDKGVRFVLHAGNPLHADLYDPEDGVPLPMRIGAI